MKKYIVGICDDEKNWCEKAERIISDYAEELGRDMEVVVFHTGEEIMSYEGTPLNVVFMDIKLEAE